jgi:hypothetical protein
MIYTTDPCKNDFSPFNGFCFHIYASKYFVRSEAQKYCHFIGGKLATLETEEKWLAAYNWIEIGNIFNIILPLTLFHLYLFLSWCDLVRICSS